jgi:DNA helicase-2/ATP-dependent DNA helicase PcrA
VAITRARDKLIITSCRRRKKNQSVVERAPSPFLEEIPARLVENHNPDTALVAMSSSEFISRMKEKYG